MSEALEAAQRVIGGCDTDTIAELVEELFLAPATRAAVEPTATRGEPA